MEHLNGWPMANDSPRPEGRGIVVRKEIADLWSDCTAGSQPRHLLPVQRFALKLPRRKAGSWVFDPASNKIFLFFLLISCVFPGILPGQEALTSTEEQYYGFLALQGLTERPYLNYRTLSDSAWTIPPESEHIWQDQNLGAPRYFFDHKLKLKIYGPEWFSSVNTAAPYGQNDGALWQGRGYNTSLSGGIRLEAFGVEATLKPQLAFSQNAAFDYTPPAYSGSPYTAKAEKYGYFGLTSIDAPQRFGDLPFFSWDWGDSEIRYTWKTLTIGFGTQAIWLGPGHINSILHSNNAPTYPKLDFGLRRQRVIIPKLNWYLGDVEFRMWIGRLSESKYFDNIDSNNNNMITAASFAFAPSVLPGLTLFVNRNFLTKWDLKNLSYLGALLFVDMDNGKNEEEDQRMSIGAAYLLPAAGIEVYGELAKNDGQTNKIAWIRYPFHAMAYLVGLRKDVPLPSNNIRGELSFEWTHLEMSQDFQFQWPSTFYSHHIVTQGYTNQGQWLGAGIGTGGNSQYLGFKVYFPKGNGLFYLYRVNPDNDYLYQKTINTKNDDKPSGTADEFFLFNTKLAFGTEAAYFITPYLRVGGGFVYQLIVNPNYQMNSDRELRASNLTDHNFNISLSVQMFF
jgi:hypothetical protein